jgi:hypothetical protein
MPNIAVASNPYRKGLHQGKPIIATPFRFSGFFMSFAITFSLYKRKVA